MKIFLVIVPAANFKLIESQKKNFYRISESVSFESYKESFILKL